MAPETTGRQRLLLDRLVDLLLHDGFQHLTLAALAARLHCSKSTLYTLGRSKEQVIVNAVVHFFRNATEEVEAATAMANPGADRIVAYLRGVADALRPASDDFMFDLQHEPAAREVYERNTQLAARRVSGLIVEGVTAGAFREVHAAFVADTVAATMTRIQSGSVREATGLSDSRAYDELAALVLTGIRSGVPQS